jgi:competence protein ComEC
MGATQIIVDGGSDNSLVGCVGKYMPYFDRKIEYLIISHPDADHFVGAVEILRRYFVERVIINGDESDLPEWREFEKLSAGRLMIASAGDKIKIGKSEINFLSPEKDGQYKDNNDRSLVFKFLYTPSLPPLTPPYKGGESLSILFTGDLPEMIEKNLVQEKVDLSSDILKVGHHGSKYSSSEDFLRAVSPKFATISVGAENSYGHPNYIILKRLENLGIKYLRTDESGDIVVNFD